MQDWVKKVFYNIHGKTEIETVHDFGVVARYRWFDNPYTLEARVLLYRSPFQAISQADRYALWVKTSNTQRSRYSKQCTLPYGAEEDPQTLLAFFQTIKALYTQGKRTPLKRNAFLQLTDHLSGGAVLAKQKKVHILDIENCYYDLFIRKYRHQIKLNLMQYVGSDEANLLDLPWSSFMKLEQTLLSWQRRVQNLY